MPGSEHGARYSGCGPGRRVRAFRSGRVRVAGGEARPGARMAFQTQRHTLGLPAPRPAACCPWRAPHAAWVYMCAWQVVVRACVRGCGAGWPVLMGKEGHRKVAVRGKAREGMPRPGAAQLPVTAWYGTESSGLYGHGVHVRAWPNARTSHARCARNAWAKEACFAFLRACTHVRGHGRAGGGGTAHTRARTSP